MAILCAAINADLLSEENFDSIFRYCLRAPSCEGKRALEQARDGTQGGPPSCGWPNGHWVHQFLPSDFQRAVGCIWVALFLIKIEFLLPNCALVVVPQVYIKGSYFPFKLFFMCRCRQGHCWLHHEESPWDTGDRYVRALLNEPVLLRNN